jgi:UDP-glucuronate 4-epimerase
MRKTVLVTGVAGFIGSRVAEELAARGDRVIGIDNLNDAYDVGLKKARLERIKHPNIEIKICDILDFDKMEDVFREDRPTHVCHLAAQAGVRLSLANPFIYQKTNIEGTLNLLEAARKHMPENFVYASSSSVYGGNEKIPFSEQDNVDRPISIYAATKKATELMAHVYSSLYGMNTTALRFFTVYGPWGRPDMACYKFSMLIMRGKPIELYNHGHMYRDFTYIDDIARGVISSIDKPFGCEVFNLGNSRMEKLAGFVSLIEEHLGRKAEKIMLPMQPGDVPKTNSDIDKAKRLLGFEPETNIEDGIRGFCAWFREYHSELF